MVAAGNKCRLFLTGKESTNLQPTHMTHVFKLKLQTTSHLISLLCGCSAFYNRVKEAESVCALMMGIMTQKFEQVHTAKWHY